ncbi:FAD-dependent monooxygenase [Nocardia terpenica]|uniref:FAD-dependent monooxygenase n=1 Tax=Nocardia terpenica TaxID=455432 RepID=UPI001893EA0E|nr:FAD-dependent monooxygenase [Nocardia terpenica]MBF6066134.1 FAD-dependent monooxygenase [Nocardia terpenica]MBF6109175.1 FAD-dependent monooxygenase [Nocardia terpenica]MBF6116378.1 FAD-dependent monooxygenase [Nocardia terpenica]MBF6123535.1 FAD-dependent monooxygenase [Nocardia terpenica]MBF6156812.1 FAD-dependent monooxygenase [Nocardia terpenica]
MKVIVSGAGIAGLTVANQLARNGIETVVVEQAPGPRPQGYMIDFFGPGYDAAEAMGVLARITELGYRIGELVYLDERGHPRARLTMDTFESAVGGRLVSILRPDLELALREHLPGTVELRYGRRLVGIDTTGSGAVTVAFADGGRETADLLIGADGAHSTVRRLVFGPDDRFLRYLGFHTAAYIFDEPELATELTGRYSLTDTADRQLGLYGLRDGRIAAFALHRTADPALPDNVCAALKSEYATLGWLAPRALAHCPAPDDVYYDQVSQVVMPAWSTGRVVLTGDACSAVSLMAGQGASLAVAGGYILADQLTRSASADTAMAAYEHLWRPVVAEKQKVGRDLGRWFLPHSRLELITRRIALRLAGLPLVNRYLARITAGKPSHVIAQLRR